MQTISKPKLVLRVFDHHRWVMPRIRYASVRSKPELIRDLRDYFEDALTGRVVEFRPRADMKRLRHLPSIRYALDQRQFLLDGEPQDFPRRSRRPVLFRVTPGPVTLFGVPAHACLQGTPA